MKRVHDFSLPSRFPQLTEYAIGVRVEWFRARERSRRWNEEVDWLNREVASVVLDFETRRTTWCSLQMQATTPGVAAYCARHSDLWARMRDDARTRGDPVLRV